MSTHRITRPGLLIGLCFVLGGCDKTPGAKTRIAV